MMLVNFTSPNPSQECLSPQVIYLKKGEEFYISAREQFLT